MSAEYRVVCANFGEPGHTQHAKTKHDLAKAEQTVLDNDHHSEMMSKRRSRHWYAEEAPFRVQTREVTPWIDLDIEGVLAKVDTDG